MKAHIVVLPGDGIGPEVTAEARPGARGGRGEGRPRLHLRRAAHGRLLHRRPRHRAHARGPRRDCQAADAVLLGAVGGPKWDDPNAKVRPEQGLLGAAQGAGRLRQPAAGQGRTRRSSTPRRSRPTGWPGVDILVIRELTGGLYFGQPKGRDGEGRRASAPSTPSSTPTSRSAGSSSWPSSSPRARKKKVTSVDKANVLESSRLWRQIATEVGKQNPDVALDHMLVDTAAMRLVTAPAAFDVVVTENMFGDILTDEAVGAGRLDGHAPLGLDRRAGGPGLYEPIHGSAPDIAGQGDRQPDRHHPLGGHAAAPLARARGRGGRGSRRRWTRTITEGARTADLGGKLSTREMADEVLRRL